MASKGLGPLPRRRGSALTHGCDRSGRVVLPLARAAAMSTGLRIRCADSKLTTASASLPCCAWVRVRVRARARVRVRVGVRVS